MTGKSPLSIMRYLALHHWSEPTWFYRQVEEDFEPKKVKCVVCVVARRKTKSPTIRKIGLGRRALMRVRKSRKKELVGSCIWRVVFCF